MAQILRTAPQYNRFAKVWPWGEWPERDSPDIGVDIVAERQDGGLAAIQCKDTDHIDKGAIDSFLADSQRRPGGRPYVERIIFTTATSWSTHAETALTDLDPPVQRVGRFDLDTLAIDWDAFLADERAALRRLPPRETRTHQAAAVADVQEGFASHDRGKLIMACGTGKTLTAQRVAEEAAGAGGRVLFAAPSISLVAQALREWQRDAQIPIRAFAVCSDPKVTRAFDGDSAHTYDLPLPATTDPALLTAWAAEEAPARLTVVFSTYQSMPVIRDAQRTGLPAFDLVVCDEAHRTTGYDLPEREVSHFRLVHDGDAIRARKRLYMTATPRLYGEASKRKASAHGVYLASMDDETTYGPEFHRLNFADAVDQRLLSDYRVVILTVREEAVAPELQHALTDMTLSDLAKVQGCLNGLAKLGPVSMEFADDPAPMRRAVAFSNRIEDSKHFVGHVAELQDRDPGGLATRNLKVDVRHVDGKSGVVDRASALAWLGEEMTLAQQCHVLSNARCLTEGIDVPALDAVLFLEPRKSQIDVVQAVGRVMRRAEGKDWGYIILPVVVPAAADPAAALDQNEPYRHVWQVLQALRSHDERFDAWVNRLDLTGKNDGRVRVLDGNGLGQAQRDGKQEKTEPPAKEDGTDEALQTALDLRWEGLREAILGRIVQRCGDRQYWRQWAESVAQIAGTHRSRLDTLIGGADPAVAEQFDAFVTALQDNLNAAVTRDDAVDMLSQHIITKPVFKALFGDEAFAARNPVSQVMDAMLDALSGALEAETAELEAFYASVRRRVEEIDTPEAHQHVAMELYEAFFAKAFPSTAERLGIVYTPPEIVQFILRSVAVLLREHFDAALGDPGVHVLDPFTGTGTFIAQLLHSGLIDGEVLARKYRGELHANEILLLAYYIAAVNIESAYRQALAAAGTLPEPYEPFGGIVLTDTFQSSEAGDRRDTAMFPRNNARIERQLALDIRVIIGNPPWSARQDSHEDDNANQRYPTLDAMIADTYIARSDSKGLKTPLYDSYVRAIRWASDRVQGGDGGIIGFVTNSGFLDGKSFDGFRKTVASEFHAIYVYNLRGNQRTSGQVSQREGGKVFGSGSRAGVAILLLVKRPEAVTEPATIHYHDIGDSLSRDEKLARVGEAALDTVPWQTITPNTQGDWINQRSPAYLALRPVAQIQSEPPVPGALAPLFGLSSRGLNTSRDRWVFNASSAKLRELVEKQVAFYNAQVEAFKRGAAAPVRNSRHFKWDGSAEQRARKGRAAEVVPSRPAVYRPFFRQHFHMDRVLNNSVYLLPRIFPTPETRTPCILVEQGLRVPGRAPAVIALDTVPEGAMASVSGQRCQVLPRYVYNSDSAPSQPPRASASLLAPEPHRRDNITPAALADYRTRYGEGVTPDQIFAYVYGVLHSPEYRERYAADLSKLLPRIPEVTTAEVFHAFASAGQRLLDLHIGYEAAALYSLEEQVLPAAPAGPERYRVTEKGMRWGGTKRDPDRSRIVVNDWITLAGIPPEAHDYVVGPRSALDWLIWNYYIRTDKRSGIVNDVNDWGLERGEPRYIVDLVKRIVTVSVETVAIVEALPELQEPC